MILRFEMKWDRDKGEGLLSFLCRTGQASCLLNVFLSLFVITANINDYFFKIWFSKSQQSFLYIKLKVNEMIVLLYYQTLHLKSRS